MNYSSPRKKLLSKKSIKNTVVLLFMILWISKCMSYIDEHDKNIRNETLTVLGSDWFHYNIRWANSKTKEKIWSKLYFILNDGYPRQIINIHDYPTYLDWTVEDRRVTNWNDNEVKD